MGWSHRPGRAGTLRHMNRVPHSLGVVCLATMLVLLSGASGRAEFLYGGNWYADVDAGVQVVDSARAKDPLWPFAHTVKFDPGYRGEVRVGYLFKRGAEITYQGARGLADVGLEFETGVAQNDISTIGVDVSAADVTLTQVPAFVNLAVRFRIAERGYLTVGGGGGAEVNLVSTSAWGDETQLGGGWQIFVRGSFELSPRWLVGGFCKVVSVTGADFPAATAVSVGRFTLRPERFDRTIAIVAGPYVSCTF